MTGRKAVTLHLPEIGYQALFFQHHVQKALVGSQICILYYTMESRAHLAAINRGNRKAPSEYSLRAIHIYYHISGPCDWFRSDDLVMVRVAFNRQAAFSDDVEVFASAKYLDLPFFQKRRNARAAWKSICPRSNIRRFA